MTWWVNPPEGKPVSYPTRQRAIDVAKNVKGSHVSQTKGKTIIGAALKALLKGGTGKGPNLPRGHRS